MSELALELPCTGVLQDVGEDSLELVGCDIEEGHLTVRWSDGEKGSFALSWLRDWCNSKDDERRRELDSASTLDLPKEAIPVSLSFSSGNSVELVWGANGHSGTYTSDWLRSHLPKSRPQYRGSSGKVLRGDFPTVAFGDLLENDRVQLKLLENVRDYGFALVKGLPEDPDASAELATRVGYIPDGWRYAGKSEEILVAPERPPDEDEAAIKAAAMAEASTDDYLGTLLVPHTDFSFTSWPPGLFIFHCLSPSADGGGATILVDGFYVAERLRDEDPEAFAVLSKIRYPFHGHGPVKCDWRAHARVISVDENEDVTGIRFALPSRLPLVAEADVQDAYDRALRAMLTLLLEPECQVRLPLSAGDCLVMDNHRILHGRTGLDPSVGDTRWFRRFDVERDAAQTRLRVLARQFGKSVKPFPSGAHG